MGDRILKVNEEDVTKMTHQDAVLTLLKPTEEITLTVQHDPLPENFQVIFTTKIIIYLKLNHMLFIFLIYILFYIQKKRYDL